jgi:hypothetical protein
MNARPFVCAEFFEPSTPPCQGGQGRGDGEIVEHFERLRWMPIIAFIAALVCFPFLVGCHERRPVNVGAVVPIFDGASREELVAAAESGDISPNARGMYVRRSDGSEAIYLRGYVDGVARILLHEFVHLVESRLRGDPDAQRIVRHAFRDLCGPHFELGRQDLMSELP